MATVGTLVKDVLQIEDLTEDSILDTLNERFDSGQFYTRIGPILLVLNPCRAIKDLYSIKNYYQKSNTEPHIFDIAKAAYEGMISDEKNQSILISGESGAGKTEATKQIIRFLSYASMSQREKMSTLKVDGGSCILEHKILAADPVLESFGNAKTFRNHNSSRFGKFVKIHFDQSARMIGASILNYLLEKSRIVAPPLNERNYHIFYQFVRGTTAKEKKLFKVLNNVEDYRYLSKSGCTKIDGVDDAENYEIVKEAMVGLGISESDRLYIFKTLSAILLLGNIKFGKRGAHSFILEESYDTVENISILLGINSRDLSEGLIKKLTVRGGQFGSVYESRVSVETSISHRNSLAKTLYNSLFNKLVQHINKYIVEDEAVLQGSMFIGVLDIFGFETFKKNRFEQLLINYANENLHLIFNQHLFAILEQEYLNEGVEKTAVKFSDNCGCVGLFEKKGNGIIPLLDEECHVPNGSDENIMLKLSTNHRSNPFFLKENKMEPEEFAVKHYAEDVKYTSREFLVKNKDEVPKYLVHLLQSSSFDFTKELFQNIVTQSNGKQLKRTVAARFQKQLYDLVQIFSVSSLHFVRCFKPNGSLLAEIFDRELVKTQIKYSGVSETAKQRKYGFPMRESFSDFVGRYSILLGEPEVITDNGKAIGLCKKIMEKGGISPALFFIGKTKVFQKDEVRSILEKNRELQMLPSVEKIQRVFRGHLARRSTAMLKEKLEEERKKQAEKKYLEEKRAKERAAIAKEKELAMEPEHNGELPVGMDQRNKGSLLRRVITTKILKSSREPPAPPADQGLELNTSVIVMEDDSDSYSLKSDSELESESDSSDREVIIEMDSGDSRDIYEDSRSVSMVESKGIRDTINRVESVRAKELVDDFKDASEFLNEKEKSRKLYRFLSKTVINDGEKEVKPDSASIYIGKEPISREETNLLDVKRSEKKDAVKEMMSSARNDVEHYKRLIRRNKTLINLQPEWIEPNILADDRDEDYLQQQLRKDNITGTELDEVFVENVRNEEEEALIEALSVPASRSTTYKGSLTSRKKRYEERGDDISQLEDEFEKKERIRKTTREIKKALGGEIFRFSKLGEVYNSLAYGLIWYVIVFIHSCLFFYEPISHLDLPQQDYIQRNVFLSIEIAFCIVYTCYVLFEWLLYGNSYWKRIPNIITVIIICTIFLDVLISWGFSALDIYFIRFSRPLRMILLITHSKTLEDVTSTIIRTVPKMVEVCALVFGFMALYAFVGNFLFHDCPDGVTPHVSSFRDFTSSFLTLYVLLSGENFPAVMICPFDKSRIYSFYFISYLVIELYLILSVVVAVIVDSFREYRKNLVLRRRFRHRTPLIHAFDKLSIKALNDNPYIDRKTFDEIMKSFGGSYSKDTQLRKLLFEMADRKGNGRLYILDFLHLCDVLKIRIKKRKSVKSDMIVNYMYKALSPVVEKLMYILIYYGVLLVKIFYFAISFVLSLFRGRIISRKVGPEGSDTGSQANVNMFVSSNKRFLFESINFKFITLYLDIYIVFVVLGNVAALASYSHFIEEWGSYGRMFNIICVDLIFLFIFWMEASLRIISVGFVACLTDRWFFATILLLSLSSVFSMILVGAHIALPFVGGNNVPVMQVRNFALALSSFRILRIIPVFKRLRDMTKSILDILPLFAQIEFILLSLFYFYTVIGMELFAHRFSPIDEVTNFDTAPSAMFTVFQLLIEEDWDVIINTGIETLNSSVAIYFISFFIVVDILILNLLIGIIIETFQFIREKKESKQREIGRSYKLRSKRGKFFKAYEEGLIDKQEEEEQILEFLKTNEKFNNFMMKGTIGHVDMEPETLSIDEDEDYRLT